MKENCPANFQQLKFQLYKFYVILEICQEEVSLNKFHFGNGFLVKGLSLIIIIRFIFARTTYFLKKYVVRAFLFEGVFKRSLK